MPRRQTTVDREIPLFIVPHMIMKRIRQHGETLERVIVRKTASHFYNISIRTRPVKRELKARAPGGRPSGSLPVAPAAGNAGRGGQ